MKKMLESCNAVDESVLDFPSEDLDLDVWMKADDGETYTLRPECREKVLAIIDAMVRRFKIPQCQVNIIGSITSNSCTSDSDIDLHFNSSKAIQDKVEDLTKAMRAEFERYKLKHAESDWHLGQHPIEVYFQGNVFQDMMSVGCYSVLDDTWIVGPELTKQSFNPYSEYYDEDMRYVNNLIGSVRDTILKVYERALVFGKLGKSEQQKSDLGKLLQDAAKLFTEIRETRSAFSAPKSREDALKKRKDRKWKIADSAFKLLDKFGYLAILREYTKCFEEKAQPAEASERVIQVVRQNLGPENKKLHEVDEDESVAKFKIWIDATRQAPKGYIWLKSVNDFIAFVEDHGVETVKVVDLEHDSGIYNADGGDYMKCLEWLEFIGAKSLDARVHTEDPVGRQNMERIIKKNGWSHMLEDSDATRRYTQPCETEQVDEGPLQNMTLAALLAVPGIISDKMVQQSIDRNQTYQAVMKDLNSVKKVRMIGEYTAMQAANIIARTLYAEARNDGRDKGFMPVASVIYNRASSKRKREDFVKVCFKPLQFSCWNKMTDAEKDPKNFQIKIPKSVAGNAKNQRLWQQAMEIAADMLADAFVPVTDANSYYATSMKRAPSWGKELAKAKVIGSHRFGYLKNHTKFT